jgi:hypothetical protein
MPLLVGRRNGFQLLRVPIGRTGGPSVLPGFVEQMPLFPRRQVGRSLEEIFGTPDFPNPDQIMARVQPLCRGDFTHRPCGIGRNVRPIEPSCSAKLRYDVTGSRVSLMKLAELNSFDDREAKPLNSGLHIGRRPVLVFGNSDGDLPMMRYAKCGHGLRLALLLHQDDAEREAAYDREFRLSPLAEALDKAEDYGITLVSMKRDWRAVF